MPSLKLDTLSPFGRLAVKLDGDFAEFDRISGQIQRMEIQSDSDLDHAVKLLNKFAEHGRNISEGIQEFSKSLQDAREKSEASAKIVAERAQQVLQRKQEQDQLREKLAHVEQKAKAVNAGLAGIFTPPKAEISPHEKRAWTDQLGQLSVHLTGFIEEVGAIREEAGRAHFTGITRDTDSLLGTLQSAQRKLSTVLN